MASERDLRGAVEYLPGRLYYVALPSVPTANSTTKHFFSIDTELVYWNFFLDFGPLNLGQTYRFCSMLNAKLVDPRLKEKVIYFYSGTHPHRRANAAFLISAWAILCLDKNPDEAFRPFRGVSAPFPPWHDATPTVCSFNLTIIDTLRGLHKARECGYFDFANFNIEEYEHYEKVENGDLNWCMDGKFIMFAGPHATRETGPGGYQTLCPEDYTPYFKRKNVQLVVRLNKKYYDARKFTSQGIGHIDMYFLDGSNPPDHILAKFIQLAEETPGAVAVHCKAGLGRTGCVIACYMMKHFGFTAEEVIGWLRVVRPGSIIGPQQQWLKDMQSRMWREGEVARARLGPSRSLTPTRTSLTVAVEGGSEGTTQDDSTGERPTKIRDEVGGLVAPLAGMSLKSGAPSPLMISTSVPSAGGASGSTSLGRLSEKSPSLSGGGGGYDRNSFGRGSSGSASSKKDLEGEAQGDSLRARRQQMKEEAQMGSSRSLTPTSKPSTPNSLTMRMSSGSSSGPGAGSPSTPTRKSALGSFLSGWGK